MSKRAGLTITELVIIIFILSVLAMIAFPFLAQTKGDRKAPNLSRLKQLATSCAIYQNENGESYPLSFGDSASGEHLWKTAMLVPADWPNPVNEEIRSRILASRDAWANALSPYLRAEPGSFELEETKTISLPVTATYDASSSSVPAVGFAFNGLLSSYSAEAIKSPSWLPVFWSGLGKINLRGTALSSPTLICKVPSVPCHYVKSSSNCSSKRNGETSALIATMATMFVDGKGANFSLADTHARYRSLASEDDESNPYSDYDEKGFPRFYWTDGCHPWLFRPDYDLGAKP